MMFVLRAFLALLGLVPFLLGYLFQVFAISFGIGMHAAIEEIQQLFPSLFGQPEQDDQEQPPTATA